MQRLAWHFDFHSHKNIRINHDPDTKGMARCLRQAGVEEIITFAKCHNGFAYYPTKFGTPHPRMRGDAFGAVVRDCKAQGIRTLAYISFGIDGEAVRKRPEWAQVHKNGPHLSPDWFISVCPFTKYMDDLMYPMIREVLEKYPVDGFFFDTMGALGVCYCADCERDFRAKRGAAIPREDDDPNVGVYSRFRHERGMRLIADVAKFITDIKPDAKVGFNQIGTVRFPERMPPGIGCLTLDFATFGPQSLQASLCTAYGSTSNLPADIMNTVFNQGWGDWSERPATILEQEAVAVWARGGRPYLGDRTRPENRLDPITVRALKVVGGLQRRVRNLYPTEGAQLAPDILLLHGPLAMYGEDYRHFVTDRSGMKPLVGAHRLFVDAGANFAIVAECFLRDHMGGKKLIVLPQMPAIDPDTETALREYVEHGGSLLVVGRAPRVNGKPMAWVGTQAEARPWQDHIYLPLWKAAKDKSPVLVRGDFYGHKATSARTVLPAIRPYDCRHGVMFGWGIGPAEEKPSKYPALTCLRVGKGKVWHLTAPIFSCYEENLNWTQIAWMRETLAKIVPAPTARVVSESGSVEVVAHADADTTWAFLINHGGEQYACLDRQPRSWARTLPPVPAYPITLEILAPCRQRPKAVRLDGKPAAFKVKGGVVTLAATLDRVWAVARVDWR